MSNNNIPMIPLTIAQGEHYRKSMPSPEEWMIRYGVSGALASEIKATIGVAPLSRERAQEVCRLIESGMASYVAMQATEGRA